MVRTRSSTGVKAGGKAPRKSAASQSAASSSADGAPASKKSNGSGGNSVQQQPTPAWQNKITDFMCEPANKKAKVETEVSESSSVNNQAPGKSDDTVPAVEAGGDPEKNGLDAIKEKRILQGDADPVNSDEKCGGERAGKAQDSLEQSDGDSFDDQKPEAEAAKKPAENVATAPVEGGQEPGPAEVTPKLTGGDNDD